MRVAPLTATFARSNPAPLRRNKAVPFQYAFDHMIKEIRHLTQHSDDIDSMEPEFRQLFCNFLKSMHMPLAVANFEALLKEKSGAKFKRNDGTVNWYHEFLPILEMLELARRGRKNGGFDLKDLETYGGLEVLISSHLRHDSQEDFFKTDKEMNSHEMDLVDEIQAQAQKFDPVDAIGKTLNILINIDLMSQKKIRQPDGSLIKENVKDYGYRIAHSERANPIAFMGKQGDINHNFATLLGAPKFTAERRAKRCNEREDMYGARYGFADIAVRRWPEFANAINSLDSMMGFMLYPHFRYLESVDRYYKDESDYPVGIERYLRRVTSVRLPEAVNPAHIFLKRMMKSVDPVQDPEKYARLQNFMAKVMRPPLEPFKNQFAYFFPDSEPAAPAPQPGVA